MAETPCKFAKCPAFRSDRSQYGYCPIHHQVATVEHLFIAAKAGRAGAELKEFAQDLEKGIYPSHFKA